MYIDRPIILINRLQPAYVFPQHFEARASMEESAFRTRGFPHELNLQLSQRLQNRYHKLKQGEK